jgi:pimeloyl-ACP methyl ester carboxylesterase
MIGPHAVQTDDEQFAIKPGCSMGYTRFAPDGIDAGATVILAHGFQGNRGSMVGWAEHLASWGLEVFTPDLCHATFLDANHAQNGADLIALREHLSLASVVYAGYSAGGLAAFLATANDPAALAVLGLDMVDNDGLGAQAAAQVGVPAHDIVAEPAMCNTSGNGVAVFNATAQGAVVRVTEADHCNFQNPGDGFCGLCSAPNPTFDTATIQATIIGLSTSFLLWQTEIEPSGNQWWFEGEPWFDELAGDGIVTVL